MGPSSAATPTSSACPGRAVSPRARRRSPCAGGATTRRAGWPRATGGVSSGWPSPPATAAGTGTLRRESTSTCGATTVRFVRLQGLQAVISPIVPEMTGKTDVLCANWRVYVCVYLKPFHTYSRRRAYSCAHLKSCVQLMKINLRIRWSNLTPLGSGARGEKHITNGQFSIWSSRVKKVCKKKKKKLAQIEPQKYLSSLKKELSEKVTEGKVWFQALQVGAWSVFCTLFFSGSGDLDKHKNSGLKSDSPCGSDWRKAS